jgi:hypothetical protein
VVSRILAIPFEPDGKHFHHSCKFSSRSPVTLLDTSNLSALQVAGLEALTTLMRSGDFSDEEVIDLLAELKPRLTKLKSA